MYKRSKTERFVRYLRKTLKQKLYAIAMIAIGVLGAVVPDGDATMLVLMACFAVPMFFSKKNWIA